MQFSNWITYFKERFPLPVYCLLVGGICASGTALGAGSLLAPSFWLGFVGLLAFFALLRLMDELKDYRKDQIAHPERPLPRGLLPVEQVRFVIACSTLGMMIYGIILIGWASFAAGAIYLWITVYLWFMYREFFIGKWLEKHPLLYAISHQIILIPVCMFPAALVTPALLAFKETYFFAFLVLGAFFSYEVSRKLDPAAHPILNTYRSLYGISGCFALVLASSALAAVSAYPLGVFYFTWPAITLLLISFRFLDRGSHKLVEGVASLSLIVHLWAIALLSLKGFFQ